MARQTRKLPAATAAQRAHDENSEEFHYENYEMIKNLSERGKFATSPHKGPDMYEGSVDDTAGAAHSPRPKLHRVSTAPSTSPPKMDPALGPVAYPIVLPSSMKNVVSAQVDKAHTKSKTLLISIVVATIVTVILVVSLGFIIYFAIIDRGSGKKNDVITAHALCQAKYGKCAIFRQEAMRDYPKSCAVIPCQYRCYYPGANPNWIDSSIVTYANSSRVSGRDGLICGERSTCQKGVCKVTSTYAFNSKVDPKSTRGCIEETYKSDNSNCIDTDKCNNQRRYCQIRGQVRVGFSVGRYDSKRKGYKLNVFRCGRPCDYVGMPSMTDYLRKDKCHPLIHNDCSYTCASSRGKSNFPPGTPCKSSRIGYCWRGTCFGKERFPTRTNEKERTNIAQPCYSRYELDNRTRCYLQTTDRGCIDVHETDAFGKATTRYGSNCISWDSKHKVPKKYRYLGSTGCILDDKQMPWCYSTNPNVIWNFCYNFCPKTSIDKKDAKYIRVMTFSYSQFAEAVTAQQAAKHVSILKADIVVINSLSLGESDNLMNNLTEALATSTRHNWSVCDDGKASGLSKILVKEALNGKGITLRNTYQTVGCRIKSPIGKNARSLVIVGTNVHPGAKITPPIPGECPSAGGIFRRLMKAKIHAHEQTRINDTKKLLRAVKDYKGDDVIIAGLLGQPSHLDWTQKAANLNCNTTYKWSISAAMQDEGFTDSYRHIHPDPLFWPGLTWSSLPAYTKTPQGRYDYQYYRGKNVKPVSAYTYPAGQPSEELKNAWPSNQYSVVVDYSI